MRFLNVFGNFFVGWMMMLVWWMLLRFGCMNVICVRYRIIFIGRVEWLVKVGFIEELWIIC